ncbi:neuropeptide SIFamide receptor-like isoform X2 [Dreissena polymorpha]|uniref:neuropeptide SIFamide receptor-like isoform X2 n=1 Tax=Dreissena polymorpha TaxID=45954 RepID=UPI00226427F2|nr:neuropeptide SIFamide receptor-like isoform X2 [Dreissena polymorpha]
MSGQNNTTVASTGDNNLVLNYGTERNVPLWQTIVNATLLSPIILLGIVGNMFSLLVWIKGRRRKTSTARYLSALALADILVLGIPATEFWIANVLHLDIRAISAWILVTVTIERTISVWFPHRVTVVCRPNIAVILVLVCTLVLCLVYLPVYTGSGLRRVINVPTNGDVPFSYDECGILATSLISNNFVVIIILDLCVLFVFPFGIMLICNVSILLKVICLARMRRNTLQERGGQTKSTRVCKSQKMLKTVTRRIIILSTTYFLCNAPLCIFNILLMNSKKNTVSMDHASIYRNVFHICMFFNNGVNFMLYCLIGSGFRKDLIGIFKSGSRSSSS